MSSFKLKWNSGSFISTDKILQKSSLRQHPSSQSGSSLRFSEASAQMKPRNLNGLTERLKSKDRSKHSLKGSILIDYASQPTTNVADKLQQQSKQLCHDIQYNAKNKTQLKKIAKRMNQMAGKLHQVFKQIQNQVKSLLEDFTLNISQLTLKWLNQCEKNSKRPTALQVPIFECNLAESLKLSINSEKETCELGYSSTKKPHTFQSLRKKLTGAIPVESKVFEREESNESTVTDDEVCETQRRQKVQYEESFTYFKVVNIPKGRAKRMASLFGEQKQKQHKTYLSGHRTEGNHQRAKSIQNELQKLNGAIGNIKSILDSGIRQ